MKALVFPFRLGAGGTIASTQDYGQIVRGQVLDGLMTNLAERVMRPNYGCDIQAALFDPSDELQRRDAAGQIKARLSQYVPRCSVSSVTLEIAQDAPFLIYITVVYRPTMFATDQTLQASISASEFVSRSLNLSQAIAQ